MLQNYRGSIKEKRRQRRHQRVRGKIAGTPTRPRVCVYRSLESMYVQVVDDVAQKTILGMHSKKVNGGKNMTKSEKAKLLGETLGKQLQEKGITVVVFDRGGFDYHGRVQSLADGLRASGLQF